MSNERMLIVILEHIIREAENNIPLPSDEVGEEMEIRLNMRGENFSAEKVEKELKLMAELHFFRFRNGVSFSLKIHEVLHDYYNAGFPVFRFAWHRN